MLSAAVLASWQLVPRPRTNVRVLRNACLSSYLVFLSLVILYNLDFKISALGTSYFIHKRLHRIAATHLDVVQANLLHCQLFADVVSVLFTYRLKKASRVDTEISLYLNSPTGRSLFLDSVLAETLATLLSENILRYSPKVCCFSRHPCQLTF